MNDQRLTIRLAAPEVGGVLRRLAQLDSAAPLAGRVLLAELDAVPVAAIAFETGGRPLPAQRRPCAPADAAPRPAPSPTRRRCTGAIAAAAARTQPGALMKVKRTR
jgi:hypothetical protein